MTAGVILFLILLLRRAWETRIGRISRMGDFRAQTEKGTALLFLIILAVAVVSARIFAGRVVYGDAGGVAESWSCARRYMKGFASWSLIPQYPTLRPMWMLLDSPQFFVMFWNSVRLTAGVLFSQMIVGVPAAWGFARYDFRARRAVHALYCFDADAVSSHDGIKLSGTQSSFSAGHAHGNHSARGIFHISGIYYVSLFSRDSAFIDRIRAAGWSERVANILAHRPAARFSRRHVGDGS